jgi:ferric-dicitrate binding protein FerR (iron transport regulator)
MLDGEAYFEVPNASGAPFIVQTGLVSTRVLGTAFFVRRYAGERNVRIGVQTGKISVTTQAPHHPGMTLVAGNIGDFGDSLSTVRTSENAEGEIAWLKDELVFTNTPVSDVLVTLSRWYGYEFRYTDSTLVQGNVTAWLSTRSSAKALATLEQLLNVTVAVSGNTVTLIPRKVQRGSKGQREQQYDVWTPSKEVGR